MSNEGMARKFARMNLSVYVRGAVPSSVSVCVIRKTRTLVFGVEVLRTTYKEMMSKMGQLQANDGQ